LPFVLFDPVKSAEPPNIGTLELIKCKIASDDFLVACGVLKSLNSLVISLNNLITWAERFFRTFIFLVFFLESE
jgi:hypothetical protein